MKCVQFTIRRSYNIYMYILCVVLQMHIYNAFAQKRSEYNELRATLNYMFDSLDKNSVPTGLLRDYAIEEEDLDLFTGEALNNKNIVFIDNYSGLLSTINSASLSLNPDLDFKSKFKVLGEKTDKKTIRISVMAFEYAQIKAEALTSNLITYSEGKVKDSNSGISPYQMRTVYAACCLDYISESSDVSIILPKNAIFSNIDYDEFLLDCGNGFIPLKPDNPIKVKLNKGKNQIVVKLLLKNGKVLMSHSCIFVKEPTILYSRGYLRDVSTMFHITGEPYNGVQTSAKVYVMYGPGRTSITKPFIFVEGFDPRCIDPQSDGAWNFNNFQYRESLHNLGYDVIYVDWDKSEEYIQANANTLIAILNKINKEKDSDEANVLMCHSMGGLIGRYALKTMENENIKHQVGTYISYDTPHLGANIPIGILYGFHGIMQFIQERELLQSIMESLGDLDISRFIELGESLAYSNAAQQMLVNYVDPSGMLNNSEHIIWQKELNNLGFPKGDNGATFTMMAIANGNYESVGFPYRTYLSTSFKAESDILHLIPWLSSSLIGLCLNDIVAGLLNVLPGRTSIDGIFELYPAKSVGQQVTHINMKYKKKFLWIIPISKTLFSYDKYASGGYLFDTYPSSIYPLVLDNNIDAPNGGIPVIGEFSSDIVMSPYIPFIPVSSALSYGDGLNSSSSFMTPPSVSDTPFGANFYIQKMVSHAKLTELAFQWIVSRLGVSIIGPNVGVDGTQYSLSKSENVSWSTSDSNIATIDNNGILSVKGKGIISIIANYKGVKYSKIILVGLPRFILTASHEPGGYKVSASCIDLEYKEHLDDINDAISYTWGIKFPNSDIQWVQTTEREILVQLEEGNKEVVVFLKIMDKLGNSVTTQSVKVNSLDIYTAYNQKLYITSDGTMYDEIGDKYFYDLGRIYFEYAPNIPEEYYDIKWYVTSGKVISPFSTTRNIRVPGGSGPEIKDVIPLEEFNFIKNGSEDNQSYTYMLILYNSENLPVQYLPIIITYKEKI